MKCLVYQIEVESEIDLNGRIIETASVIQENGKVFDSQFFELETNPDYKIEWCSCETF